MGVIVIIRVALIDDFINENLLVDTEVKISFYKTFNKVVQVKNNKKRLGLSHATLCANIILENTTDGFLLYNLDIWGLTTKTSIKKLRLALEWCLENDINVINLSIGTVEFNDYFLLKNIIERLLKNNCVIIAANSNTCKLTYPACLKGVVGVKVSTNKFFYDDLFIYNEKSLDGIELEFCSNIFNANCELFNNNLISSNSFATAFATSYIINIIKNIDYKQINLNRFVSKHLGMKSKKYNKKHNLIINNDFNKKIVLFDYSYDQYDFKDLIKIFIKNGYYPIFFNYRYEPPFFFKIFQNENLIFQLKQLFSYSKADIIIILGEKTLKQKLFLNQFSILVIKSIHFNYTPSQLYYHIISNFKEKTYEQK